eukprot:scaffold22235_cov63-Phaeocystis_antarctica.AAC.4
MRALIRPAMRLAALRFVRTSMAMLQARTSRPSTQGDTTRKSNWLKKEPSCRQLSGRPSISMLRLRVSKTSSNATTDAGITTLKTLSTRVAICGGGRRSMESDHLFERRANLRHGFIGHIAQALARLTPAAPAEKEEHGQGDAYEGCQRRCRFVPRALHARRLTRVKVPRAIGDVADSAVGPGGPWLAQLTIRVCARRRVGRRRVGAAPQVGATAVCAPVSRYQGKQRQSCSRLPAFGPDRARPARHPACGLFAVVVPCLTLAVFDACRVLARLGRPGALLARASRNLVDQWLVGVNATLDT